MADPSTSWYQPRAPNNGPVSRVSRVWEVVRSVGTNPSASWIFLLGPIAELPPNATVNACIVGDEDAMATVDVNANLMTTNGSQWGVNVNASAPDGGNLPGGDRTIRFEVVAHQSKTVLV